MGTRKLRTCFVSRPLSFCCQLLLMPLARLVHLEQPRQLLVRSALAKEEAALPLLKGPPLRPPASFAPDALPSLLVTLLLPPVRVCLTERLSPPLRRPLHMPASFATRMAQRLAYPLLLELLPRQVGGFIN